MQAKTAEYRNGARASVDLTRSDEGVATKRGAGMELRAVWIILALNSGVAQAQSVPLSAPEAFKKATMYLVGEGAVPSFRDAELLMLKTDPLPMRLTTAEADCGSMFGFAYLSDKRVKTAVTYVLSAKPVTESSSEISVRVTVDGYMAVNEGAPFFIEKTRDATKVLMCKSTGMLERKLIDALMVQ